MGAYEDVWALGSSLFTPTHDQAPHSFKKKLRIVFVVNKVSLEVASQLNDESFGNVKKKNTGVGCLDENVLEGHKRSISVMGRLVGLMDDGRLEFECECELKRLCCFFYLNCSAISWVCSVTLAASPAILAKKKKHEIQFWNWLELGAVRDRMDERIQFLAHVIFAISQISIPCAAFVQTRENIVVWCVIGVKKKKGEEQRIRREREMLRHFLHEMRILGTAGSWDLLLPLSLFSEVKVLAQTFVSIVIKTSYSMMHCDPH